MCPAKQLPLSNKDKEERVSSLTPPREKDVFRLLLAGLMLKETAKELGIKYSTANSHMSAVYRKLNVNTRAELIINYGGVLADDNTARNVDLKEERYEQFVKRCAKETLFQIAPCVPKTQKRERRCTQLRRKSHRLIAVLTPISAIAPSCSSSSSANSTGY